MKKDDTTNAREEITAEEAAARRSAAAKKAAATRRAKAEAARKAEEEAKAKAEESTSTAAVIVDGTEASATATNDVASAEAKVATDGTKAEAKTANDGTSSSSSAVIVLPAGDTGKNDANTQSDQYVAPATYSDNTNTSKKEEKGGTMKRVLNVIFGALIVVLIALLLLCGLRSCNGAVVPATPSAISADADAEAKISALSAALSAQKAENEALRAQLSASAPVNVNVDNSNTVNIDMSQYVDITTYNQLFNECENFRVENSKLTAQVDELEGELSIWNGHVCPTGGNVQIVYRDREVEKTVTVVDEAEVDRLNQVIASLKADIAWLTDQLAAAQEKEPQVVTKTETKTVTVRDTAEIDRLNSVINSLNARIAELEAEISSHVCPAGGIEYVYVPEYIYVTVPSTDSGTPEYNSQQPEAVWPGEGDGSTITSPDRSGGSITGGN